MSTRLKDFATAVVAVVEPETTAMVAAQLMRRHHIGALVVVDAEQKDTPVGIVTDRDLVLALRKWQRKIVLAEDEQTPDRAFLYAQCLQPGDVEEIISAIRHVASEHQERNLR